MPTMLIATHPLRPERFADLEALFGGKGCSFARGCWCMLYREVGKESPPEGVALADFRKSNLRGLAEADPAPGLIGYDAAGRPVGWVALGPRESFAKLQRSRVMRPVDDRPAWSVVCFVVPSVHRGQGAATALLQHAVSYAGYHGARIVEGYPIDKPRRSQGQWLWHGAKVMFDRAGFREVARRKPERAVMRIELGKKAK